MANDMGVQIMRFHSSPCSHAGRQILVQVLHYLKRFFLTRGSSRGKCCAEQRLSSTEEQLLLRYMCDGILLLYPVNTVRVCRPRGIDSRYQSRLPPGPPEPDQGTGRARNVKQSFAGARVLLAQEIHIATETSEMSPSSTKRESESLLT